MIGNDSLVTVLVNFLPSVMKLVQTMHFLAGHLVKPHSAFSLSSSAGRAALTRISLRLRGRRKAKMGGSGNTDWRRVDLWSVGMCFWIRRDVDESLGWYVRTSGMRVLRVLDL